MVLKISIRLPGQAEITCEASEPALCSEVLALALRELPRDLIQLHAGGPTSAVTFPSSEPSVSPEHLPADLGSDPDGGIHFPAVDPGDTSAAGEQQFVRYCLEISPVGDMRRVVVASWAADRFLGTKFISDKELPHLFDLAGWRRPDSFIQTLRNSARSKFRWLERLHGRAGYYSVTDIGIQAVIPDLST